MQGAPKVNLPTRFTFAAGSLYVTLPDHTSFLQLPEKPNVALADGLANDTSQPPPLQALNSTANNMTHPNATDRCRMSVPRALRSTNAASRVAILTVERQRSHG